MGWSVAAACELTVASASVPPDRTTSRRQPEAYPGAAGPIITPILLPSDCDSSPASLCDEMVLVSEAKLMFIVSVSLLSTKQTRSSPVCAVMVQQRGSCVSGESKRNRAEGQQMVALILNMVGMRRNQCCFEWLTDASTPARNGLGRY